MMAERGDSSKQEQDLLQKQLFQKAESFFANGMWSPATELYEEIIEMNNEHDVSDEQLMSYFRMFYISCQIEPGNTEELLRFIPFRHRLEDIYVLEGLYLLSRTYAILDRWEEARQYASELLKWLEPLCSKRGWSRFRRRPAYKRSPAAYYGRGLLIIAESYKNEELYADAREWLERCTGLTERFGANSDKVEAQYYVLLARMRVLALDIVTGDLSQMPQLAALMGEYPQLTLDGLSGALQAANKYGFPLEDDLEQGLQLFTDSNPSFMLYDWGQHTLRCQYGRFYYQCAAYWLRRGELQRGAEELLRSLKISLHLRNQYLMLQCLTLYEKHHASLPDMLGDEIRRLCQSRTKESKLRFPWRQMLL